LSTKTDIPRYVCKECGFEFVSVARPCPECGGSWKPIVLAGPETAAEHVRNALMILGDDVQRCACTWCMDDRAAVRARLARALEVLEQGQP
jgi:predicted ATP-dependent serine protease